MKKFLVLACLWILLAPAPWGIALKHQTKECAGYWAGDEYTSYALPAGWQAYYPDNHNIIKTDVGSCQWNRDDWDNRAENCCRQLGYTYVTNDLGAGSPTFYTILLIGIPVCGGLAILLVVAAGVVFIFGLIGGGAYLLFKRKPPRR